MNKKNQFLLVAVPAVITKSITAEFSPDLGFNPTYPHLKNNSPQAFKKASGVSSGTSDLTFPP